VQHITYVSPWLRRQIIERKLEQPLDQGRIWRVVPADVKRRPAPKLSNATVAQLVPGLNHPNGWVRDTVQRLLVERGGTEAVAPLEQLAKSGKEPLGRLHALWTLEGLEKLTPAVITVSLSDPDPKLRAAAIRLSEPFLATDAALADRVLGLAKDKSADVQLQLLCTLGQLKTAKADAAIAAVLSGSTESHLARSAAISGLKGRELEFLQTLLANPAWQTESPGRTHALSLLARCVTEERKTERVQALLDLALAAETKADWQRVALLSGASGIIGVPAPPAGSLAAEQAKVGAKPQGSTGLGRGFKPIKTKAAPPQLAKLTAFGKPDVEKLAPKVSGLFVWPGKPGYVEEKKPDPLTPAQEQFVAAGKQVYATLCVACHQPNGQGQEGLAPPLANSEWVTAPEGRVIRIVLQGVGGPMTVNGKDYSLDMPGLAAVLGDEQIAQVLSYIRRDFGNLAPVVETASVAKVRAGTKDRGASWTAAELENIH
jgi:mono/diheme cytochrome c family protein